MPALLRCSAEDPISLHGFEHDQHLGQQGIRRCSLPTVKWDERARHRLALPCCRPLRFKRQLSFWRLSTTNMKTFDEIDVLRAALAKR